MCGGVAEGVGGLVSVVFGVPVGAEPVGEPGAMPDRWGEGIALPNKA